jgi:two-component system, NarL family, sensor histidine kinase DevS
MTIDHIEPEGTDASRDPSAPSSLTFPDLPRLELDELLRQLIDRAHEVMATQGRLRGLLRASQMVTRDLTLPAVLRRIVEAARELVGARYAALGVISPAGGLAEFVHSGMPEGAVERIGHLPAGKGLLGALIEDPRPIRLRRIGEDERSVGFPPGHPPMDSFLGVPIVIRDEVFGNLYLAESTKGEFSAEDEELTKALAATAAVAIENARLYEAAQSRGEWLQAVAAITRQVLAADPDDASQSLELIAETSLRISRADLVTVVLPAGPERLAVEVAVGAGAQDLVGSRMPTEGSLSGRVLSTGTALRQSTGEGDSEAITAPGLDVGAVLAVPLHGSTRVHGVLWAARRRGQPAFGAEEVDMAAGFANQAALAIELAEARAEQQRAVMLDERERIAADLHDHVIQRLFAAGLSLQSTAGTLGPGKPTDRILAAVDDLDATIRQIRTSIFRLQQIPEARARGLRARLLDVATDLTPVLGFEPTLRISGALDVLPDDVAEDVAAVVRESLSNVARHARAASAEVDVSAGERLTIEVRDDGVGIGTTDRRSGLHNLRRRAERHGGTLEIRPREPSGTCLCWSIPLD